MNETYAKARDEQIRSLTNNIVIFDLDGCISDDEWRLNKIQPDTHPDRWGVYHSLLSKDRPLAVGLDKLNDSIDNGCVIAFVTARPERWRAETAAWLRDNVPKLSEYSLWMRESHQDGVSAVILKSAVVDKIMSIAMRDQAIMRAYDDREDIVDMYLSKGIPAFVMNKHGVFKAMVAERELWHTTDSPTPPIEIQNHPVIGILASALETFRERNKAYGDNADKVAAIVKVLFPVEISIQSPEDHKMMLQLYLLITKLTRFTNSGMSHQDSVHDMINYSALLEVASAHRINAIKENPNK